MPACVGLLTRRKYTEEYILYNFISSKKWEKNTITHVMSLEHHYGRRCTRQLVLITSICWEWRGEIGEYTESHADKK